MRVAYPTEQLEALTRFYNKGLGLPIIGQFSAHDGYDGVIFGLPDAHTQLEFTQHASGGPIPRPHPEDLIVFYMPDADAIAGIATRLDAMGYERVTPENPYWHVAGTAFADPDGRHVIMMHVV